MPTDECCEGTTMALEARPTALKMSERVKKEKQGLVNKIADLDRMTEILEKNPDIEELLNILSRSNNRRLF